MTATFAIVACDGSRSGNKTLASDQVEFNRDIRPILNEHCTGCHGGVTKQAGISFIIRDEALGRGHSGRLNIVPGKPNASELIARVESLDPNLRMPYKAAPLSPEKITLLRRWIEQGAQWQEHWAFVAPTAQNIPPANKPSLIRNPIDHFVQAKLSEPDISPLGLKPAKSADKSTLLRRASFDLTGLPPSQKQLQAFLRDGSVDAFEKQVDQLLASPRFGEHWAAMWLDIARYADSQGYTRDEYRAAWPYRDWVINALNDNMSYRDFIIKQLAGDLLPNRTLSDLVATGFHRQTPVNSEGGTDDEEFRTVAVIDRVATTWSALNGVSMNCVQCHSHPYDPIKHREFYTSYSFLNTTEDADKRGDEPLLRFAKNRDEQPALFSYEEDMLAIRKEQAKHANSLAADGEQWRKLKIVSAKADEIAGLNELMAMLKNKINNHKNKKSYQYKKLQGRHKILLAAAQTLEESGKSITQLGTQDGDLYAKPRTPVKAVYTLTTQVLPHDEQVSALRLTAMPFDPDSAVHTPAWGFSVDRIQFWLVDEQGKRQPIHVESYVANSLDVMDEHLKRLNHLNRQPQAKVSDASGFFAHRLFHPRSTVAVLPQPLLLRAGTHIALELALLNTRENDDEHPGELRRLRIERSDSSAWLTYVNSDTRREAVNRYAALNKKATQIDAVKTPVMYEQDANDQRATAVFYRGNFLDKQGPLLRPDTPSLFPALKPGLPRNRMTMATWFFQPDQPLTARVAVNRFWFHLFGRGLVESLEDFGGAGTKPSHPALLDWLALTFQDELSWNIKALLKLMVMSHTYQQDARVTEHELNVDPGNRWLSRGPRQRLSAEMVRDQALMASGLLSDKMGGEPVMPPQPDGIWGRKGQKIKDWKDAKGEDRYRRSIYTFIKRAYIYPSLLTFDMETRELSHARRMPTNTPLQALVTLNDPVYHEAAQALATEMLAVKNTAETSLEAAIRFGARRVLSRDASDAELASLVNALNRLADDVDASDHHTIWTALASILLNLDAAMIR